jgi:hypothetical protein
MILISINSRTHKTWGSFYNPCPWSWILSKGKFFTRHQWLMPITLATQEEEIRRIAVPSQLRQIVPWDPISKKPFTQKRAGGVAQGIGPEYHHHQKKNKKFLVSILFSLLALCFFYSNTTVNGNALCKLMRTSLCLRSYLSFPISSNQSWNTHNKVFWRWHIS